MTSLAAVMGQVCRSGLPVHPSFLMNLRAYSACNVRRAVRLGLLFMSFLALNIANPEPSTDKPKSTRIG